jgi:hypothetical protein
VLQVSTASSFKNPPFLRAVSSQQRMFAMVNDNKKDMYVLQIKLRIVGVLIGCHAPIRARHLSLEK